MATSAAGAITILAIDIASSRLKLAMEIGGTHTIDGFQDNIFEQTRAITGKGVEFALDATGIPAVTNGYDRIFMKARRGGDNRPPYGRPLSI
jgi:aryl-alcohol dehydrogenase